MKISTVGGNLPQWMTEAFNVMQKNMAKSREKKAETVKVENLPSFTWNDFTYYVKFKESSDGALIYNKQGTIVREIDHATTVDQVKQLFNENDVRSSIIGGKTTKGAIAEDETSDDSKLEILDNDDEFERELSRVAEENPTDANTAVDNTQQDNDENNAEDNNVVTSDLDGCSKKYFEKLMKRVSSLEQQVNELTKVTKAYTQAQHAYSTEITDMDNGASDADIKHYQESADETREEIQKEHDVDMSRVDVRTHLYDPLIESAVNLPLTNDAIMIVDDSPTKDDIDLQCANNIDDIVIDEAQEPATIETVPEDIEDTVEIVQDTDDITQNDVAQNDVTQNDVTPDIILLTDIDDINNFNNKICPCCGQKMLQANEIVQNYKGIVCNNKTCKSEYALDTTNGNIWMKKA